MGKLGTNLDHASWPDAHDAAVKALEIGDLPAAKRAFALCGLISLSDYVSTDFETDEEASASRDLLYLRTVIDNLDFFGKARGERL